MNGGQRITIVDFGMGNLGTVQRKFDRVGARAIVSSRAADVLDADKIVLPGVGHFGQAMQTLRELTLLEALQEVAQVKRRPILGICLGMQLMAKRSEAGAVAGLGWLDADVTRFEVSDPRRFKVPHIGWSKVTRPRESALLRGVAADAEFYFSHGYTVRVAQADAIVAEGDYSHSFVAGIERGNLFGVHFHPEKSHNVGERVLQNFMEL